MAANEALLMEFDQEMANTRKTLERIPDGKFDWKPHAKSATLRQLALHVALFPNWMVEIFKTESLDIAPPGAPPYRPPDANSRQEILEIFDRDLAAARTALSQATDADLRKMWTLLQGGTTLFAMPRAGVLRGMVMNHMIHHRAQLGVYLRLNDVPVPGFYGPSADEMGK